MESADWAARMPGDRMDQRTRIMAGRPDPAAPRAGPARRRGRWIRIAAALLVVAMLAAAMAIGGFYLLLRGDTADNSSLNNALQSAVQKAIGPGFSVDFGRTSVALGGGWLLMVTGRDIVVKRADDGVEVARIAEIDAGIAPLSVVAGRPTVRVLRIADTQLDVAVFRKPGEPFPPADLETGLSAVLSLLERQALQLGDTNFRGIQLSNLTLLGAELGSRGGPARIQSFRLALDGEGGMSGEGEVVTRVSTAAVEFAYGGAAAGRKRLDLKIGGVSLGEWFAAMADEESFVAAELALTAELSAETENGRLAGDPTLTISSNAGRMRLGRGRPFDVSPVSARLRLLSGRNQIELDPSVLAFGRINARLIGGIRPLRESQGYGGPLQVELIADPAVRAPEAIGQPSVTASFQALGMFDPARQSVEITDLVAHSGKDQLRGSMQLGYGGRSPSVAAKLSSAGMGTAVAKFFWPAFLAPPARTWFENGVVGGRISELDLQADIPGGVFGYLRSGARIENQQLRMTARFSGVRIDTYGDLPALRNASGHLELQGMGFAAKIDQAEAFAGSDRPLRISGGEFAIANYADPQPVANIRFRGEGSIGTLATALEGRPVRLQERTGSDVSRLGGNAAIDAALSVPLTNVAGGKAPDWNVKLALSDVASEAPFYGYRMSNGELALDIDREKAKVAGDATLDGFPAKISMTEWFDRNAEKSERRIQLLLDEKTRARNGMTLDPVLTGLVRVLVTQNGKRPPAFSADLSDAVIDLPWIGWRKGKGIAARATFKAERKSAETSLSDLFLEGQGFSIAGSLKFGKSGLASADFADVSLNAGDSLAINLARKGNGYLIRAEGARFDARGLINKLVHVGGFGEEQGGSDVTVKATIGAVKGFNDVTMQNVSLTYGTAQGWFDNLSLRGTYSNSNYVSLVATTSGKRTVMDVDATDAGQAMRMADFYRRMRGGRLQARLTREGSGPFRGPVRFSDFVLNGEPLLKRLVSEPAPGVVERGVDAAELRRELDRVETDSVRFTEARADIDKGNGYFRVSDGALRNARVGIAVDGILYNQSNRMDIAGTFMPGLGLSRAIGLIPIVGQILGDGRDTSLIGVNFRLSGPARDPLVEINPLSAVTPGVFRKIFEFKTE
jgi:hypothetical protein